VRQADQPWAPPYWEIIRFDAANFLATHASRQAEIYHDRRQPGLGEDLRFGLRSIAAGVVRQLQGAVRAMGRSEPPRRRRLQPYLLLIAPRDGRYAREEREVSEACAARGMPIVRVLSDSREVQHDEPRPVSLPEVLTARDHVRVLGLWLRDAVHLGKWWLGRDRKARSLSAVAIHGLRQYYLDLAFARRIDEVYGRPRAVLSLAPWSDTSVAIVDTMKARGVATWGIRTQTTVDIQEHLAINVDFLFCKGIWERRVYGRLFRGHGPRLVDGCLLSLPDEYSLEALGVPESFVLLLGATRRWNESEADFRQVSDTLERLASVPGLPVVYRAHPAHAAKGAAGSAVSGEFVLVADLRRNAELIAKASLIVSVPSTLLYQAILARAPTVVLDIDPPDERADEFIGSPLLQIRPDQVDALEPEDLAPARQLAAEAYAWLASNYFLGKGAVDIVDQVLSLRR
jgi:hypothetical protein